MKDHRINTNNAPSVHIALSGGVDSAVSAALLVRQGYTVTGVFMKNWSGEEYGLEDRCPWKQDQEDAQRICDSLGIPFRTYNFEKEYRTEILDYFFEEYRSGRTPNPDILCNKTIKFGFFLKRSQAEGADLIATGHYAQKEASGKNAWNLVRAVDQNKDQTYFLYRLSQDQLRKTLFPVGSFTKSEVRALAKDFNLPVAQKKDSQGICFLGAIDVREFLAKVLRPKEGSIIDADTGETVGKHEGVWFYTNGQREGLRIGGAGEPYFVAGKSLEKNVLYVAQGRDNPRLYARKVSLSDISWVNGEPDTAHNLLSGVVRYRQAPQPCTFDGGKGTITFKKPVWLPSPGQSAVIFEGETVIGGGIIETIQTVEAEG